MNEALQIATLVSAVIGWLTVIIGGINVWTRFKITLTELQGKVDNLVNEYKSFRLERDNCEKRERERTNDHEERIRKLEEQKHLSINL